MIFKIYKTLRIIFFILFLVISVYSLKFYEGSIFVFGIYCLSFIVMLYYLTDNKSSYFEVFFSSYLFLGFWFKYVFSLILYDGKIYDSGQIKSTDIDEVLIIGIFIAIICLISSFINKNLISKYLNKKNERKEKSFFENFYLNNRILILLFFLLFISIVGFLNYQLGIHLRGFLYQTEIPPIIKNLTKWLLLFGFTTFSCFLIHVEIKNLKKINIFSILIVLLEVFISYTSMLSRSFIINAVSLILPTYQQSVKLIKKYDNKFFVIFLIILFFTMTSLYGVNHIRAIKLNTLKSEWLTANSQKHSIKDKLQVKKIKEYNFEIPKTELKSNNLKNEDINNVKTHDVEASASKIMNFIIINRWIGIDSLILIYNSEKKGFDLFFRSLNEKKKIGSDLTFYENEFGLSNVKVNIEYGKTILKGNTLPGIITFLYYSGNLLFLFISLFVIIILCNYFEKFLKNITNNNLIFVCFISNMIATRLIHFGYAPKDTYLFITSVLLSVFFMVFLLRFKSLFLNKR